jgi:hypothetical protein
MKIPAAIFSGPSCAEFEAAYPAPLGTCVYAAVGQLLAKMFSAWQTLFVRFRYVVVAVLLWI